MSWNRSQRRAARTRGKAQRAAAALLAIATLSGTAPVAGAQAPCDLVVAPPLTIQLVVNLARPGDTVCVTGGVQPPAVPGAPPLPPVQITYTENPNVVIGAGKDGLVLMGLQIVLPDHPAPRVRAAAAGCTIAVAARNVQVMGLEVVGGPNGNTAGLCFLPGSAGSRAEAVNVHDHARDGVLVNGTSGIEMLRVRSADNLLVGIHVKNASSIAIRNADVLNNGRGGNNAWETSGIRFLAVTDSAITNSLVQGNGQLPAGTAGGVGIYLNGESNDNLIEDNRILRNFDDGINLESNPEKQYGDDVPEVPRGNVVRRNTINYNHHEGIHVYSGSANVFDDNNHVIANKLSGIVFECATGEGNVVRSNILRSNGAGEVAGLPIDSGIVLASVTATTVESNTIENHPGDGLHVARRECRAQGEIPEEVPGPAPHALLGNTIRKSGEHGIHVRFAQGVVARGNAINDSARDGLHVERTANSTLIERNVVLRSGDDAVEVLASGDVLVLENELRDNKDDGLFATRADRLNASRNLVESNAGHGLNIADSESTILAGNSVNSNSVHGVLLVRTTQSVLHTNSVDANGGDGIRLGGSDANLVALNKVNRSGGSGVVLDSFPQPSNGNLIRGNTVNANGADGVRLAAGSARNCLELNRVEGNKGTGVFLESGAWDNCVLDNSFIGNGVNGNSQNPAFTNKFFHVYGTCPRGNYWSDVPSPPASSCPNIRDGKKWIPDADHEVDMGPLVSPPS